MDTQTGLSVILDYFITGQMKLMNHYVSFLKEQKINKIIIQRVEKDCDEYLKMSAELFKEYGRNFRVDLIHARLPKNAWVNIERGLIEKAREKRRSPEKLTFTEKEKAEFTADLEKKKKKLDII